MNDKNANGSCYIIGTSIAVSLLVAEITQEMSPRMDVVYFIGVVLYFTAIMRTLSDNRLLVRYGLTVSLFGGLLLPLFVILYEVTNNPTEKEYMIVLESKNPEHQWLNGDIHFDNMPKVGEDIEYRDFYVSVLRISHKAYGRTVLHISEPKLKEKSGEKNPKTW